MYVPRPCRTYSLVVKFKMAFFSWYFSLFSNLTKRPKLLSSGSGSYSQLNLTERFVALENGPSYNLKTIGGQTVNRKILQIYKNFRIHLLSMHGKRQIATCIHTKQNCSNIYQSQTEVK